MAERYDAIIIGGGHNGLTCGAYLARAGLKTLVLERRAGARRRGGDRRGRARLQVLGLQLSDEPLHPRVIADLELARYGYQVLPATDMFGPLPGKDYIIFADDIAEDAGVLRALLREGRGDLSRIRSLSDGSCQDHAQAPPGDAARSVLPGLAVVQGDGEVPVEIPPCRRQAVPPRRRMTMSADDYLSEWFERSEIKAVLAYYCGIGTFVGPKSPGPPTS